MLWAQSRGNISGNMHKRPHVNRIKNGAMVRGTSFVDFLLISSQSILQDNTVPIGIFQCFYSPLTIFASNLSPIE